MYRPLFRNWLRIGRRIGLRLSLALLACIAVLDVALGPQIDLRLLYLLPMLIATFSGGLAPGLLMAAGVTAALLVSRLVSGHLFATDALLYFDLLSRLVRDAIVVLIAAALRAAWLRERASGRIDALTGLLSHHAFRQETDAARARARDSGAALSLCHLDLDGFRAFNSARGYAAGDELLRAYGQALRERLPEPALVARLGGDEYAVLLPATGVTEAVERMRAVREALRERFPDVSCCAGIAAWSEMPEQVDSLLRSAASQMYSARALGRDRMRWAEYGPGFRTIAEALGKVA